MDGRENDGLMGDNLSGKGGLGDLGGLKGRANLSCRWTLNGTDSDRQVSCIGHIIERGQGHVAFWLHKNVDSFVILYFGVIHEAHIVGMDEIIWFDFTARNPREISSGLDFVPIIMVFLEARGLTLNEIHRQPPGKAVSVMGWGAKNTAVLRDIAVQQQRPSVVCSGVHLEAMKNESLPLFIFDFSRF